MHGNENEPATYSRGSNRIDYALSTPEIYNYISACGILPLHEIAFSDHRPLFFDIQLKEYLGGIQVNELNLLSRILSTSDPRSVKQYQVHLTKALNTSDIEERIKLIKIHITSNGYDDDASKEIESIDAIFTALRLSSEKKCRQSSKLPWSPKMKEASRKLQFWKIWLSQKKLERHNKQRPNRKKQSYDFQEQRKKYSSEDTIIYLTTCTKKMVQEQMKLAKLNLQEIKRKAVQLRDDFLLEQAIAYRNNNEIDKEKEVRKMKNREKQRITFRKLKSIMGKNKSSGLDHILIESNGSQTRLDGKDMIAQLLSRNSDHFSQAEGSPFTKEPLKSLLGPFATNDFSDTILNGTAKQENLPINEPTKTVINLLRKTNKATIKTDISWEELQDGYKKWSEGTSTSPSGMHLGHEKALLKFTTEQEKVATETGNDPLYKRVFSIIAVKLNWAVTHGHVYNRWTKVVNAMIEKIPGIPLINKLRVIHLMESDYNLMIGILWGRRLLWKGESDSSFDVAQYGSRPNRRAQELLTIKDSTMSISRMTRRTTIFFDNDAKSCFDRIVMTLASLTSQQIGMTKSACKLFLDVLDQTRYHVKTVLGISEEFYSSTEEVKLHGPGQGGRGSPGVWLMISSVLLKALKKKSSGLAITNPFNKSNSDTIFSSGFVDDITHWINQHDDEELQDTLERMNIIAQWWEALLYTTGGKLELSKCFLYVISWSFRSDGIPYITDPSNFTRKISIEDSETKQQYDIEYKKCTESHKSLGVMFAPEGNNNDEFKRLLTKAKKFSQAITNGHISRYESSTLYNSYYIPSISYGLCVGSQSMAQCKQIQGSVSPSFKSTMGFMCSFPGEVTYGPINKGGIGMKHMFSLQGETKTSHLIRMIRAKNQAGKILVRQFQWAQQTSGLSTPILQDNKFRIPQLKNEKYITTLMEYLHESNIQIEIQGIPKLNTLRANDQFIMEIASSSSLTDQEIVHINTCRMYLKAKTVSQLTSMKGTHILHNAYECQPSAIIVTEELWPKQQQPKGIVLHSWKKFIKTLTMVMNLCLTVPLGNWKSTTEKMEFQESVNTYFHIPLSIVLRHKDNVWYYGTGRQNRRGLAVTQWLPFITQTVSMRDVIPTETISNTKKNETITWSDTDHRLEEDGVDNNLSWDSHVFRSSPWEKDILSDSSHLPDFDILIKSANELTVICCCTTASSIYSWSIITESTIIATGSGKSHGTPTTTNRSSAFSHLGWCCFLNHALRFYNIRIQTQINVFTSHQPSIKTTRFYYDIQQIANTLIPDYDVICEIHNEIKKLSKQGIYVKDAQMTSEIKKQGNKEIIEALPFTVAMLKANPDRHSKPLRFPTSNCNIYCDNIKLSSNERYALTWNWCQHSIDGYYKRTFNWSDETLQSVAWDDLHKARSSLHKGLQTYSTKSAIGWLATGHKMEQIGHNITDCIHCQENETFQHMVQCPGKIESNNKLLARFQQYMISIHTAPSLADSILFHLKRWFQTNSKRKGKRIIRNTGIKQQNSIGWDKFISGMIASDIINTQLAFENKSNKKHNQWSKKIITWWITETNKIWTERNSKVHEQDNNQRISREQEEAITSVRQLYELEHNVLLTDRILFETELEKRLTQHPKSMKAWSTNILPRIRLSVKAATQQILDSNNDIRKWFKKKVKFKTSSTRESIIVHVPNKKKRKKENHTEQQSKRARGKPQNHINCPGPDLRVGSKR